MTTQPPDFEGIRRRVTRALERSGPQTLIGYDANGIQAFVTRTTALPYMRGASELVKDFDRKVAKSEDCLFAAGGRGRLLMAGAPTDAEVQDEVKRLRRCFARMTRGEVLAVAAAPLEPAGEARSLTRLALELDRAKDAAPPPTHTTLYRTEPFERCKLCRRRPCEGAKWHRPRKGDALEICEACDAIVGRGNRGARDDEERGMMLEDLSPTNRIAVLAADGNQMGALFASIRRLPDAVVASEAVSWIFESALEATRAACELDDKRSVAPVVGGDDIRLFAGPERIFPALATLVAEIESRVDAWAGHLGFPPAVHDRFARIGIGAGLVVGPETHPASLAIEQAHLLEDSAKRHCKDEGYRSAVDFIHLRSGDELLAGGQPRRHPLGVSSSNGDAVEDQFGAARCGAAALRGVPTSQRAIVLEALGRDDDIRGAGDPEFLNFFRYQVARSASWQGWYEAMGRDWRDAKTLDAHAPTHAMLEIARLNDVIRRAEREGQTDG